MAAAVVSLLDRQILTLLIGPVRHSLGITDTQVSVLQGFAFATFYTVLGLPIGYFVDRLHRRNLIICGILIWSVMTMLCGLSRNFWELFAARVGVGVGEAVLHPAAYSLIFDYFTPKARARAFGLFTLAGTLGISASWAFGGVLLALVGSGSVEFPILGHLETWKAIFIVAGLPGFGIALFLLTLKEPVRRERALATAGIPASTLLSFLKTNWRPVGLILTVFALINLVGYGAMAWMAAGFVRTYGLSLSNAGFICACIVPAGAVVGAAIGGGLADRWSARGTPGRKMLLPVLSGLVGAVAFAGWWLTDNLTVAVGFAVLAFAMQVTTTAVSPAVLNELVPNELRGRMSAVYLLVMGIVGIGFGPTAVALFTDYVFHSDAALRYSLVAVTVPALLLAALLSWLGLGLYERTLTATRSTMTVD
jgi:MFS family permease